MTVLISTLGLTPGGVVEIVKYLRQCGEQVNKVVLIRTSESGVEHAAKLV